VADIPDALKSATKQSLWISTSSQMTDALLQRMTHPAQDTVKFCQAWGNLLTLESPAPAALPFLRTLFKTIVGESKEFQWLPFDQLVEILAGEAEESRDVFIGGVVNTQYRLLTLVRGNCESITVPLSMFRPSATTKPDFSRFRLADFGHSVCFGDYEAAAHFVLYGADADYRRRVKKSQRVQDKGFGASLRRLRLLKGVPQTGFPGLSSKTIARLENGEVERPRGSTLKTIADTLDVTPELIESY
ncbi:MAG: helix-turn-helix domain-containing protein, partial [Planctomycetes bacterium]|nr:helix-turn-helix domain-containing protein [Planctomycetota bacterium]